MKFKKFKAGIITLIGLAVINTVAATDYSSMTTEELMDLRYQASELSAEDRESLRSEMRGRIQTMTDDERASFQSMRGQGSGSGGGKQHRYGKR
ncbi:MAG: hypothetical protein HOM14_17870 [Gammaproteobacteria bacterium]|jgi:hypothetical protein|nr:hypothetical protein [Gammaproteobacteria bacterium]MBT3723409.1 hypothetical protein [Gammaproteobacteria bacterium]MBT4077650.1 hypothetical protein [Gammaproteobacteria bacterium]MBT4196345.1 hypothetical protein [Gammaproteobacteria bacterium]MBT4452393.1 hypothetical protein [Gammaproteobacteria bacterium]